MLFLIKKIFQQNKSEDGIAIVFALGFLSLLFMLSSVYVVSSLMDKKASENVNALQSSRMIVQAGLNRCLASLNKYISDETLELSDIYSYRGLDSNDYSDSLANLLETTVDGVTYFEAADYSTADGPHWQYLPENHAVGSVPITGRIAYMVIAESGKLDLSACIDNGFYADSNSNNNAVSEGSYISDRTSLKFDGSSYVMGRPGRDVNELFLDTLDPSWFTSSYAQQISSYFASPRGELMGSGNTWKPQWDDFTTLFTSLSIEDDNIKSNFRSIFSIGNSSDPEAFWIDDGDENRESNEFYKRFQLNRNDWNDITVDSIKNTPPLNTSSDNNHGILWFKNWKTAGDMGSVENCQNQVIANLIDYCDTDIVATTDNLDRPTYVGLEKCPYLNELKLCLFGKISVSDNIDTSPYISLDSNQQAQVDNGTLIVNYDPSIDYEGANFSEYEFQIYCPYVWYELVNLYSTGSTTINTKIDVDLSIDFLFGDEVNPGELEQLGGSKSISHSIGEKSYEPAVGDTYSSHWIVFDDIYPKTIKVIDESYDGKPVLQAFINNIKVKLSDNTTSEIFDYSYIVNNSDPVSKIIVNNNDSNYYYNMMNYEVSDPRQNLYPTDWEEETDSDIYNGISTWYNSVVSFGSFGAANSNFTPNPGGSSDPEPDANEPWELSTAYIRNGAIKSPWELGFIHRGKAWQTLNLKSYNITEWAAANLGGGNSYLDGDANLLDQIKMTPNTLTQGKVNINSQIEETLEVLFEKIELGTDITNTEGTGDEDWTGTHTLDAADANNLAAEILSITSNSDNEFLTRAQLLRPTNGISDLYDDSLGLNQETDATKEELIGKFINLCKSSQQDTFYIIVVAQQIKDAGTAGDSLTLTKDGNKDGTASTVSTQIGRYDSDGDEILSTKKLFAIVKYTGSKFYIHFLKYLDN